MRLRSILPACVAVALLAAACSNPPLASDAGSTPPGAQGSSRDGDTGDGSSRPALLPLDIYALPSFDPGKYQELLGQLRGTPVVVNIWASWCGPCREEAPILAAASSRLAGKVQFLGIDILDTRGPAVAFMKEFHWTYPSVFDAQGSIRDGLGFIGQPISIFYGADGKVASTWQGPLTPAVLGQRIRQILPS